VPFHATSFILRTAMNSTFITAIRLAFSSRYRRFLYPLHLGFQHAAEKNDPGYLGQEVRVLVDLRHALKKLRQGSFCGRAGDRLGRRGRRKRHSRLSYGPDFAASGFDQSCGS
jgi:hypothetical protein